MARKPRIEFPGASYHLMARGNERARIFKTAADYDLFLRTLGESLRPFGGRVHAWVLMPNHYHLAVTTPRGNLSRWMGWLQTTFTSRYNRRHRRVGHLFQGRYRAQLVETDTYARILVEYIHLNPVRKKKGRERWFEGGMKELSLYRWSSHPDYLGLRRKPLLEDWDRAWMRDWGRTEAECRRTYRKEMAQALGGDPLDWQSQVERGLVAGGEEMVEMALKHLQRKTDALSQKWGADASRGRGREKVLKALEKESDVRVKLWVRRKLLGEKAVDLARIFDYRDGSGVTHAVKTLERGRKLNRDWEGKLDRYEKLSVFMD